MSKSTSSAWWQLLRAGNVFTAVSNVLAGFLLVHGEWQPLLPLVFLIVSSASLYLAGMVLNDVFDIEIDRAERPERPLPAGRIDPMLAKVFGWGLMADGVSAAGVASWLLVSWLPLIAAMLLATTIIAYDTVLKSTALGPLAMGACRALNILLGASAATSLSNVKPAYIYAFAIGVYTVGLTLLARDEATPTTESKLKLASNIIQFGCLLIIVLATILTLPKVGWFAAWLLCLLAIRTHLYEPVMTPSATTVQRSVSRLITMFIPLDALACVAATGWSAGLIVLTLLIPTYIATRRVPMT